MKILTAVIILASLLLGGCMGTLTVGGQPIVGIEGEKDREGKPVPMFGTVVTVHQHGAGMQPQPSPPGTPPLPPRPPGQGEARLDEIVLSDGRAGGAQAPSVAATTAVRATYPTVYNKTADPTIRVFSNQSPNAVRLQIDGEQELRLEPWQSTKDMSFRPGEHRARVTVERPTSNFGILENVRSLTFMVTPEGGWQQIYVGY